jgi:hypothetical protein
VNSDADRQRAKRRWQNRRAGEQDLKVALLASFVVDPLVPYLGSALVDSGRSPELWVGPAGQIEQQCLAAESETARFAPDLLVVAPRLEELWLGKPLPLDLPHQEYETGLRYVADVSMDAARRWNAELVFVLPPVPEMRPAGVGDDGNSSGIVATAARVREGVRRRLEGHAIVDAELVLRTIGSRNAYQLSGPSPFSEEFFDLVAQRISRVIDLRRRPRSPLVVLDRSIGSTVDSLLDEVARLGGLVERGEAKQVRELSAGAERVVFLSADPLAIAEASREKPEVLPLLLPAEREGWPQIVHDSGLLDQIPAVPVEHYPVRLDDDHLSPTEAWEWITTTPSTR